MRSWTNLTSRNSNFYRILRPVFNSHRRVGHAAVRDRESSVVQAARASCVGAASHQGERDAIRVVSVGQSHLIEPVGHCVSKRGEDTVPKQSSDEDGDFLIGYNALQARNYDEAENHLKRALEKLAAKRDGSGVAMALEWLAAAFERQGKTADAEACYERALALADTDRAVALEVEAWAPNGLAVSYIRRGKGMEAQPLLKRHLAYWEQQPDAQNSLKRSNMAVGLSNLAKVNVLLGNTTAARALYQRALATIDKVPDADQLVLAHILDEYASLLRTVNLGAQATRLESRAFALRLRRAEEEVKRLEDEAEKQPKIVAKVNKNTRKSKPLSEKRNERPRGKVGKRLALDCQGPFERAWRLRIIATSGGSNRRLRESRGARARAIATKGAEKQQRGKK